jgi:Short C-terminal domain
MNGARVAVRIGVVTGVLTLVVAVIGFVGTLILNAFVFGKYNAYGEVPIPGSGSLHLPAGEVTVNFHTEVIGSPRGGGLPIPQLKLGIDPPAGVPQPTVTESIGSTTTVNNDSHVRVWRVQVPAEGTYHIRTDGPVGGFISPRLAFGQKNPYGSLVWVFVALFVIGLLNLTCVLWWSMRSRLSKRRIVVPAQPVSVYASDDEGIKLEQLKTLSSLRDSGALTEAEFEAEKRRILDGG